MTIATVNLAQVVQKTDPGFLGVVSSTYGASPVSDTTLARWERQLDARYVRIPVRWNGSNVVSSAGGSGVSNIRQLVDLYRSWGYRLLIVIAGRTSDWDGYVNGDATEIIKALGTQQIDYQSPNEPNNSGHQISEVVQRAQQIQRELDAFAPGPKLWGPVWASYNRSAVKTYAQGMGGGGFGGASYHHYAMGSNSISTAQSMSETSQWGQEVAEVLADLASLGLPPNVVVDELNYSWQYSDSTPPNGDNGRFFTAVNTVWQASALGHVLRAGGRGMPYATQNGPLGVLVEAGNTNPDNRPGGTPMPAYWGIAAWTGAHTFPHFKDAFYDATSDDPMVEVYAVSNEAGGVNVIVINKDENNTKTITINVGTKGTLDHYQTSPSAPYDAPQKLVAAAAYDQRIQIGMPRMSVSTLVLVTSSIPIPVPAPTPVPTPLPVPSGTTTLFFSDNPAPAQVTGGTVASNAGAVIGIPTGLPTSVFDHERWGEQTWTIPLDGGDHKLDLYFAEKFTGVTAAGQRVFEVIVNGVVVVGALDVFALGGNVRSKAVSRTVALSGVKSATVTLKSLNKGAPFINALRIR